MANQTVRARYANGVFTPLEPVEIEEGCDVVLECSESEPVKRIGLPGVLDAVRELHAALPEGAWDDVPSDLAQNKDHHRFGHPKDVEV